MSKSNSASGLTATRSIRRFIAGLTALCAVCWLAASCNPDAKWATEDVTIDITPTTISAGYIECAFATDKEAYYLIDCVPAVEGYDPSLPQNQKQFMMLAIDSAIVQYLDWRHDLLKAGEFNIAPFASHCLQYGTINHFFTNLKPDTDYWIFAFVVNPDKLEPAGKLYLQKVTTTDHSVVDVKFEYRVRGYWDYIYPLNPDGKINNHFPYLASTCDEERLEGQAPEDYFDTLFTGYSSFDLKNIIRYGTNVMYNDGVNSNAEFEEGHTYYTAIVSYDGFMGNNVIYKFTWTGEDYEAYFTDEDSIVSDGEDD